MSKSHDPRASSREPTPYAELNAVLAHLLHGARQALGDNFVGAYLQGSFAVGDFTEFSDCDFIVVMRRDLAPDEIAPLQALHEAIHELPCPYWRTGLEGSYVPATILKRLTDAPRDPPGEARASDWRDPGMSGAPARVYPFWYLDHGAKRLVRSEHDNTNVVRWCLREKGVVLAGPEPKRLVDVVTPSDLRAEVRRTMDLALSLDLQPMELVAWQAFWVGLFCRMLHTLATGAVWSKKASMAWAQEALDPAWRDLIARAAAVRKSDEAQAGAPADRADAAATRAFALYARDYADQQGRARDILDRRLAEKRGPGGFRSERGGQRLSPGGHGGGQFTPPPMRPGGRRGRG